MNKATKTLLVILIYFYPLGYAGASALSGPECFLKVMPVSYDGSKNTVTGQVVKTHCSFSRQGARCMSSPCAVYRGLKLRIEAGNSPAERQLLPTIQSYTIGVEKFSSMGENGPVRGVHWSLEGFMNESGEYFEVPGDILTGFNISPEPNK